MFAEVSLKQETAAKLAPIVVRISTMGIQNKDFAENAESHFKSLLKQMLTDSTALKSALDWQTDNTSKSGR
ncbi:MAG TPA: hypothetical protein VH593_14335 [Ktedonobacteraceae bacterium]